MCVICDLSIKSIDQLTKNLLDATSLALLHPACRDESDKRLRLKRAFAEYLMAVGSCYGFEPKDGNTNNEFRADLEERADEYAREKREEIQELSDKLQLEHATGKAIDVNDILQAIQQQKEDGTLDEEFIH